MLKADTTPYVDTQEYYEHVRAHFSEPGAQLAKDAGGRCIYRTASGRNGCAVGCAFPDELYYPGMEDKNIYAILNEAVHAPLRDLFIGVERGFIGDAQQAHDNERITTPEEFLERLDDTARHYNLEVPTAA